MLDFYIIHTYIRWNPIQCVLCEIEGVIQFELWPLIPVCVCQFSFLIFFVKFDVFLSFLKYFRSNNQIYWYGNIRILCQTYRKLFLSWYHINNKYFIIPKYINLCHCICAIIWICYLINYWNLCVNTILCNTRTRHR